MERFSLPPNFKWSPSALKSAHGCKRRFKYRYLLDTPREVVIPEFEKGRIIHSQCELFLHTGDEASIEELPIPAKEALKEILSWREYGQLHLEKFFEDDELRCIPDIVYEDDEKYTVLDIKSRLDNTILHDDLIQLYAALYFLQKERPKEKAYIGVLAVYNQLKPLNIEKAHHVTYEQLKKYIEHQKILAERSLQRSEEYNVSFCRYCEYIISCDVGTEKEKIEEVARKYIQLQSLLKRYEKILRDHVNFTGENIKIDNMEVGMHIKNITRVDSETLIDMAKQHNIPIAELFRPDITAIKKLAKIHSEIANAVYIEQKYYFTAKKQEDNGDEGTEES